MQPVLCGQDKSGLMPSAGFQAEEGGVALSPPLARPTWQCGPGYRELTRPAGQLTLDLRGSGAAARVGGRSTLMRCALAP